MNAELDYDLSPEQWETLKALRAGATQRRVSNQFVLGQLVALGLAATGADGPVITPTGRKILIRGSSRLWFDVAA
jgi:hypothetical protein